MSSTRMHESPFERLRSFLRDAGAPFRVIEHAPAGVSAEVSRIRGNDPGQAAKALVLEAAADKTDPRYILVVLPGNRRLNFDAVRAVVGYRRVRLAPAAIAEELTGCVMGAVPPFAFDDRSIVIVDSALLEYAEIVFNAGRLDRSMFLSTDTYLDVVRPAVHAISLPPSS